MYDPWGDAARRYPQVHIEWRPILPALAVWSPAHDLILVDESISRAERRCALAHEIAHMDTGDQPTDMCFFARRQETNADRLAARRLVEPHSLAGALAWCEDPREIAEQLDVTLNVLLLRCSMLHPSERGLVDRVLTLRERVA